MATTSSAEVYASKPTDAAHVRVASEWPRVDSAALDSFRGHSVANIGDALGRLGMPDGGISPIWEGCTVVGNALTVLTTAGDDLAVINAVDHIRPGDVVIINGFGYLGRAVMGDVLARRFASRGGVGAIVDGAVRDRDEIRAQAFPVWARAVTPCGPWKNGPGAVGEPVAIGGVVVNPGDVVVGDSDGVAVVPYTRVPEVLSDLSRVVELERRLREETVNAQATNES